MPGQLVATDTKPFIGIVGGNITQKVAEGTEGARRREYETSKGVTGVKFELVYMNWKGKISGLEFEDTDFGSVCKIDLGDAILCLNTSSRYFTDFACKIFTGDLSQEFLFHPYSIEGEEGKKKQGISLQQNGVKLKNYFYNPETKLYREDFPIVDEAKKEKLKKNYWKTYFAEVEAFLTEKLQQLKFNTDTPLVAAAKEIGATEIDLEDLPF